MINEKMVLLIVYSFWNMQNKTKFLKKGRKKRKSPNFGLFRVMFCEVLSHCYALHIASVLAFGFDNINACRKTADVDFNIV